MCKRKLMQCFLGIASLAIVVALSGCAKQKTYGAVKFTSNPVGAEVVNLKDDATLGNTHTPLVVFWEAEDGKAEYVTVQMRKTGYREEITSFWVNTRHETREEAEQEAQHIIVDMIKRTQK